MLSGRGSALAMAHKRTQLAWHRSDPRPQAGARSQWVLALLRRLFA